jgi:2-C-methyl-D-erythritol 4-phosphate cytidylyltransferase
VPVTDTIKVVDALVDGWSWRHPGVDSLVAVQTPQAFRAEVLRAAHAAGGEGTDDAASWSGRRPGRGGAR